MSELEEKYKDIIKLARGRSIKKEHDKRNLLRKKKMGKKSCHLKKTIV